MMTVQQKYIALLSLVSLTTLVSGCGTSGPSGGILQQAEQNTNNAAKLDNFISGTITAHIQASNPNNLSGQDQQTMQSINTTQVTLNEEVKRYQDQNVTRYLVLGSSQYDVGIKQTLTPISYYAYTPDGKNFTVDADVNQQWHQSKQPDGNLDTPLADGIDVFQLMQYSQGANFQNRNGQFVAEVDIPQKDNNKVIPIFTELIPQNSLTDADLQNGSYIVFIGVSQGTFGWEFTKFQLNATIPLTKKLQQQGVTGNWFVTLTEKPAVSTGMTFVIPAGVPN